MKKRKVRKKVIIGFIVFVLAVIIAVVSFNLYTYYNSDEYKLGEIGYSEKEVNTILKLDRKYINYALKNKYDKYLIPLTNQKYMIWKKYDEYVKYIKKEFKNEQVNYENVVTKVNTKTIYAPYTHTETTDMKKGNGILVNKYYGLPDKYEPNDVVPMNNWYSYPNNSIRTEVYEAFKEMSKAAKESGITLIVNSSYRNYESQKQIYDEYEDKKGKEYADKYAARPNYSEHQTGLALDIFTPGSGMTNFENTEAFKWLSENCYKYGFILRYPKDKEDITGYKYESWHYRYLGKDLAKKVYDSNITFDEYYAYYLDK